MRKRNARYAKRKAGRNKTIDFSVEEGQQYLERCISVNSNVELSGILDRTILGDCFEVMPYLPTGFVDLLIADPPYNLDKNLMGKSSRKQRMLYSIREVIPI